MTRNESDIESFWQAQPVGENVFGALQRDFRGDLEKFFRDYDTYRYRTHSHLLGVLNQFDWRNKRVLEIGLGQGADSEQLIGRGARWSGIDLTAESVRRVKQRLALHALDHNEVVQGSALSMPFPTGNFDVVFSHGVLHHIPDILTAQREIRRVLRDDGMLIVMLYARRSLNYQLSIRWVRRLGLALLYFLPVRLDGVYAEHKTLAREQGLLNYLKLANFVHRSTDGPRNPYSKVYDEKCVIEDFPDFEIVRTFKRWMHAPPLPVHGLPGQSLLGWHLWAVLRPKVVT